MPGLIAIVGRPNVGKSALFNRIVGKRIAIVHDQPGVTRDRISAEAEWRGHPFSLVDTGGIGLVRGEKAADPIVAAALDQVGVAIEAAQVIILVVNVQEGVTPLDREVAGQLRRSAKPILVAINKVDHPNAEAGLPEFSELGFPKLFPVSAIHGEGIEPLMDAATAHLPGAMAAPSAAAGGTTSTSFPEPGTRCLPVPTGQTGNAALPGLEPGETEAPLDRPLKLAVVGRPNVGKSSLINALTQSERVIVSPVPGTTRDAIDVPFEVHTDGLSERYLLIDTAGIRKTRRVTDSIEFFSVKRAEQSVERADIVLFILDAEAGILEQDKKVADRIVEARRACILVVNKWDLAEADVRQLREEQNRREQSKKRRPGTAQPLTTLGEFGRWVQERMFFLDYAPVIFTSAKSGFQLDRLLEAVRFVAAQLRQRVPTALLNRTLHEAIERRQPVSARGDRLKFFYATQVRQAPPTFLLFVNRKELFTDRYSKYLAGEMRRAFGFEGCPLVLVPKSRERATPQERRKARDARAVLEPGPVPRPGVSPQHPARPPRERTRRTPEVRDRHRRGRNLPPGRVQQPHRS